MASSAFRPHSTAATSLPAGPPLPAPIQTARLWRNPASFLAGCERRFGPTFTLRLWPIGEVVVVSSPESVQRLLAAREDELLTGAATHRLLPMLGERSLPCLDGAAHMQRRRLLLPVFGSRPLAERRPDVEAAFVAEIGGWPVGKPFRALPRLREVALAIACDVVLGARSAELAQALDAFVAGRAALGAWLPSLAPARRTFERRRLALDGLLLGCVRRPAPGEHALATLLAADVEQETIVEELRSLLLVAHESTACALAWTLERLARHPTVLDRLRDGDETYADAIAREVLRSRPPVLDAVRLATGPLELEDRYRIPAGKIVMVAPLLVHHRRDLYPDPGSFRPERFLDQAPPAGAFVPFGGGERRCLGAQLAMLELNALLTALRDQPIAAARPAAESPRLIGTAVTPGAGAAVVLSPA